MNDFKLRTSISQQGDRNRPFFSRSDLHRAQAKTSYNQKRSDIRGINKLDQPGLYFDANQAKDIVQFQNPLISKTQSQQQLRAKSGFAFSEKSQKLYSPYEYLHYATKLNGSKEQYLNALQQLGYDEAKNFQSKPLNKIINNTSSIISTSYSVKYMGIIDGNMGILTNRKRIQNKQNPKYLKQQSLSHQGGVLVQNYPISFNYRINQPEEIMQQDENLNLNHINQQIDDEQMEEIVIKQASLDDRQSKQNQEIKQVSTPNNLNQMILQDYQQQQQQLQIQQQQIISNQIQSINDHINQSHQPQNTMNSQRPINTEPTQQKTPQPETYSTYLVGKYSLPRGLKSVKKMRDPTIQEQKLKLEQWHAEKIKVFEVGEQFGGGFSIQSSNPNKSATASNFFPKQTFSGQSKQQNFMRTTFSSQIGNARMKSSLYKKPLHNYEENAEEEQNPNSDAISFSKLLQNIDQVDPQQVLPRVLSANKMKNKQKPPGVFYEQNQQLYNRYQQLEAKTHLRSNSPNKSISQVS